MSRSTFNGRAGPLQASMKPQSKSLAKPGPKWRCAGEQGRRGEKIFEPKPWNILENPLSNLVPDRALSIAQNITRGGHFCLIGSRIGCFRRARHGGQMGAQRITRSERHLSSLAAFVWRWPIATFSAQAIPAAQAASPIYMGTIRRICTAAARRTGLWLFRIFGSAP